MPHCNAIIHRADGSVGLDAVGGRSHLKAGVCVVRTSKHTRRSMNLFRAVYFSAPLCLCSEPMCDEPHPNASRCLSAKCSQPNSHLQGNRCSRNAIRDVLIGCRSRFIVTSSSEDAAPAFGVGLKSVLQLLCRETVK